jgi:hypothetical protein
MIGGVAHADSTISEPGIQKTGPEDFPSRHELSAHLGFQVGFGGAVADPSGMKFIGEYAYRFHRILWFDVQATQLFGFGARTDACATNPMALCYRGGWATGINAGVKVKLPIQQIPLVVEIPILLGLDGIYNRECSDNGVAIPVVRAGVGAKYFIKKWVGLGAGIDLDFGPAFHDAPNKNCKGGGGYTDFYGSFDIHIGAEFIL